MINKLGRFLIRYKWIYINNVKNSWKLNMIDICWNGLELGIDVIRSFLNFILVIRNLYLLEN